MRMVSGAAGGENRSLAREVARRRTFAIISHPDAGKTTLTEKLLLYGGALRQAGAVRGQRAARHATSDWLELEKQRGISVSSSALYFDYKDHRVNILDTPGHQDFSEDTYRTLMAADSAVMLMDAAKGVEAQTRKLFQVCRMRQIPIFTFVNKMDRFGRDGLDLMDEIESLLGIDAVPVNWPVGSGSGFRGVYDRLRRALLLYSGGDHGTTRVEESVVAGEIDDPHLREILGSDLDTVGEELELLDGAGAELDLEAIRAGLQTPMFFGSALTNYAVEPFLDRFLELAPCPGSRTSNRGEIDPIQDSFSGFVFKIQANMDPDHRDRIAFMRICSGRFVRGETTTHVGSGKPFRLTNSTLIMGSDRQEVEVAYPGDVVGLFDPGLFHIGDTVSDQADLSYLGIPSFSPEAFMRVEVAAVTRRKALEKGIDQLVQEGAVQFFEILDRGAAGWVLGAMGPLQFEVMRHRLQSEYRVDLQLSPLPFKLARWPRGEFDPEIFRHSERIEVVRDSQGRFVILAQSEWDVQRALERHEGLELSETADPHLFEVQ
jgi:peptide chain release factor 3